MKKTVSSIGEFGIIDLVRKSFARFGDKDIVADIGDDAFCFKLGKEIVAITKDMLIEDVHFKKGWTSPFELSQKAIEVNISDLAAMGTITPKYIFIGLGLPADTPVDFVGEFTKGLKKVCAKYKVQVAGGDTVKAEKLVISITAIGLGTKKVVKRSGAKIGDLIGITNTFGDAGAGVDLLYKFGAKYKYSLDEKYLISKQNSPKARLKEANKIAKYLTSLTDASDGLYFSIGLLTKESHKGAEIFIEKIPVSKQLKNVIKDENKQINYALFGAEDFELVFSVPKSKAAILKKLVPQISYIGQITNSKKVKYIHNGKIKEINYSGFKHF